MNAARMLKMFSPPLFVLLGTTSLSGCALQINALLNSSSSQTDTSTVPYRFSGVAYPGFGDVSGSSAFEIYANSASIKDDVQSVVVQSDGKILMGGHTYTNVTAGNSADGMVIRLNANGTLDTSFNSTGKYFFNSPSNTRDVFYSIQEDGTSIYAFGFSRTSTTTASQRAVVVKINSSTGTIDTSFGTSGAVYKYLASNGAAYYESKLLPDGKMLAFGHATISGIDKYILEKLNADGSYDTSFGTGGTVTYNSAYIYDEVALKVDDAGRIVVAFLSGTTSDFKTTVVRYLANGTLDSTFGTGGVFTYTYGLANYPGGMIVDGSSIYIIGGWYETTLSDRYGFVLKLDSTGALVTSFGNAGRASFVTNPLNTKVFWNDGKLLNDRIYLSGYSQADSEFIIGSISTSTGELDVGFGTSGIYSGGGVTGRSIRAMVINGTDSIVGVGPAATLSANQQVHAVKIR